MARRKRNESPERQALREMMAGYLKDNPVKDGKDVNSIMREMMSVILEGTLDGELDDTLGYSKYDYKNKDTGNSRNGYSRKTMHTSYGDMDLDIPRDRNGEYEPQVIKKYQNTLTQDMEEKIISMYAKGMTTGDIESHLNDLYGINVSDSTISRVTDKILPIVKEWQERPLEDIYAVVFLTKTLHFHFLQHTYLVHLVFRLSQVQVRYIQPFLLFYLRFLHENVLRLKILNGLKNRGVKDILIACIDGLTGFPQAISAVFPDTEIQHCIIHQIRNTTKFVSYKDIKELVADLKKVYAAATEDIVLMELDSFAEKWNNKYPNISKSWYENWATLSTYFKYPDEVRKIIYTTNTVEGFNRQLRKVTKNKSVFPTDDSLLKMLYLAAMDITRKWTGHRQDWGKIRAQLVIYFEERITNILN